MKPGRSSNKVSAIPPAGPVYNGRAGQTRTERIHLVEGDGSVRSMDVYRVVNVATDPDLKPLALAGHLHSLNDGRELAMPFVYHDPSVRKFALVIPSSLAYLEMKEWARLMQEVAEDTSCPVPAYVREGTTVLGLGALQIFLETRAVAMVEADTIEHSANLQDMLDARSNELQSRSDKLASREQGMEQREQELADKQERLPRLIEEVTTRERALQRREEQSEAARKELEARDKQLEAQQQQLAARDQQLEAQRQQVDARDKQLEAQRQQLDALSKQLEATQKDLPGREQQAQAARKDLETQKQQVQGALAELRAREQRFETIRVEQQAQDQQLEERRKLLEARQRELEASLEEQLAREQQTTALRTQLQTREQQLESQRAQLRSREQALSERPRPQAQSIYESLPERLPDRRQHDDVETVVAQIAPSHAPESEPLASGSQRPRPRDAARVSVAPRAQSQRPGRVTVSAPASSPPIEPPPQAPSSQRPRSVPPTVLASRQSTVPRNPSIEAPAMSDPNRPAEELSGAELRRRLEEPTLRLRAIRELCRRGHPAAIAPIFGVLQALTPEEVAATAVCLLALGGAVSDGLVEALDSPSQDVRHACALGLGQLRLAATLPQLMQRIETEPTPSWAEMARALGDFGALALPAVVAALPLSERRERLMVGLAHLANHGCGDQVRQLENDPDPTVAMAARQALARCTRMGEEDAAVRLQHALRDNSPETRFSQVFFATLAGSL